MALDLSSLIAKMGQEFSVERNGIIVGVCDGALSHDNRGKRRIAFYPEADVLPCDWVIDASGKRFYVEDTETAIIMDKTPYAKYAYVLTEIEHGKSEAPPSAVFNIGEAHGSIIGTQANAIVNYADCIVNMRTQIESSDSDDKVELQELVNLFEQITKNKTLPQKGIFSKFSVVMARNSWITNPLASALLSWLASQS